MEVSSPSEILSVFVLGAAWSGKSTFINTVCDEFGSVILQQTMPSSLDRIPCGLYKMDDKRNLILYKIHRSILDIIGIPDGQWIGVIIVVDSQQPETFREVRNRIAMCRGYLNLPILVVDNPHRKDPSTGRYEYVGHDENGSDSELRLVLQIEPDIPIIKCDVSDAAAVKSVLDTLVQKRAAQKEELLLPLESKILFEKDVFVTDHIHHFLLVVGTQFWYSANYFMELLADRGIWVSLDQQKIPRRWGHSEIDSSFDLHIIPIEQFGSPKNGMSLTLESILALAEGQRPPAPVIEGELVLPEGIIGCIGIFNSHDELSVDRTKDMIKAFGDYPYVIIDTGLGKMRQVARFVESIEQSSLGSRHPIMRVEKLDKVFAKQAICLLIEQISGDEAEKLRLKFDWLQSFTSKGL
jgi:hypothetical protein